MVSFFTLIPLLFATSANANNDMYPTYQYSVHLESQGFIPSEQYVVYRTNSSSSTIFYSKVSYEISGDVYFNDDSEFYIPHLQGNLSLDFYSYNSTDDEYVEEDSLTWIMFDIAYLSSSSVDLGISFNFTIRKGTSPFGLYLDVSTPLNTTSTLCEFGGAYTMPNNQNPISWRFDDSNVLSNINLLISNYVANGYNLGYDNGYNTGYSNGLDDGLSDGYQQGYGDGFQEASAQNSVAVTIFAGICEVGLLPVNVFLGILNFEVFGINIGGFVASLMTIAIVVIVIRVVLGAKSKE